MANIDLRREIAQVLQPVRPAGFENATLTEVFSALTNKIQRDAGSIVGGVERTRTGNIPTAAGTDGTSGRLSESISNLTRSVNGLLSSLSIGRPSDATSALGGSAISSLLGLSGSAGSGGWSSALSAVNPVAGLFSRLFRGGNDNQPAPLPIYIPNQSIQLEAAAPGTSQGFSDISYGVGGLPRRTPTEAPTPTSININVQTMDSRSFADHSEEIARAVRSAMLNMHSLNDVVGEM